MHVLGPGFGRVPGAEQCIQRPQRIVHAARSARIAEEEAGPIVAEVPINVGAVVDRLLRLTELAQLAVLVLVLMLGYGLRSEPAVKKIA